MIVYKVLNRDRNGVLSSAAVSGLADVHYGDWYWSTAPEHLAEMGYHLLVFSNFDDAAGWAGSAFAVYRAEAEEQIDPMPPSLDVGQVNRLKHPYSHSHHDWPEGTMMFKRVRLLESST